MYNVPGCKFVFAPLKKNKRIKASFILFKRCKDKFTSWNIIHTLNLLKRIKDAFEVFIHAKNSFLNFNSEKF